MKIINQLIIRFIFFALLTPFCVKAQKLLDNHIEAMEQFSRVQSKSKSLVSYAKRNLAGTKALDSAELMYMELKETCDGALSRYKSIIDNPSLAKKTEATITENLNEMQNELSAFQLFIISHSNSGLGFQQANPVALITTFTGFGAGLIKEINSMQKAKRDTAKKEIEQYKLSDWVAIE